MIQKMCELIPLQVKTYTFRDLFSRTVHIFKKEKENDSEDVWIDSITSQNLYF